MMRIGRGRVWGGGIVGVWSFALRPAKWIFDGGQMESDEVG